MLLAGIVLFLQTKQGTVRIEINDPAIEVVVDGKGATIKGAKPEDVVRILLDVYLPGGVGPQATVRLVEFVKRGNPARGAALDRRVRETVHAIVSMPEYQLA